MNEPLVTIGIACYNAAPTIEAAIKSAQTQDWPNLEIIVVDDRSTDDSPIRVKKIVNQDARIRFIVQAENTGVGGTRSRIIKEAQGEFVAFFDDDDVSALTRVSTQMKTLLDYEVKTGQRLVACYASGERRYSNGYVRKQPGIGSQPLIPVGDQVVNYLLLNERVSGVFYGAGTPACALMARKSVIEETGGFDSRFRRVEDLDFAIRLAYQGGHFIGCAEDLYTQNSTSGEDKSPEANFAAEKQLLEKNKAYLEKRGLFDYAMHWFEFRFYYFAGQRGRAFKALLQSFLSSPLKTLAHFFRSVPKRLLHESRMRAPK